MSARLSTTGAQVQSVEFVEQATNQNVFVAREGGIQVLRLNLIKLGHFYRLPFCGITEVTIRFSSHRSTSGHGMFEHINQVFVSRDLH